MSGAALFFALLVGHALADFPLQTDAMAAGKNRNRAIDPAKIPPGATLQVVWPYWLASHALVHGGVVALITGSVTLGVAETVLHWMIDFAKCENWTGIHTDQGLHIGCKLLWVVLI
jgi:hypothetical protein